VKAEGGTVRNKAGRTSRRADRAVSPAARQPRLSLAVQYACDTDALPLRPRVRRWVKAACEGDAEVTVRFVDGDEGRVLNRDYRGKDYATNVLSFPYEREPATLGDLVICLPVLLREAAQQGKSAEAHCAHLIVHGMLHLQGYDHETSEEDAQQMEARERSILARLGFADPYLSMIEA
jgi:probable rRNA maturation factor